MGLFRESIGVFREMRGRLLIAIGALFIVANAHADEWADGNAAFASGDYAAALSLFEAARDSGASGPAVHYNIAVCQYKLERYEDAGGTFAYIAREYPQMAGLAEYNLGLVSQRLDEPTAAVEHFLRAYRLSPDDETLRVLASNQLSGIEPEARPAPGWSGAFGVRAGYDDNIALQDTAGIPLGITTESPMLDLFGSVSRSLSATPGGIRFEGSVYGIRYFDADDFDQNEVSAGAIYEWRPGSWRVDAGAHVAAGWLGGDEFDRRLGLHVEGNRSMGENGAVNVAYYYDDISEGDRVFEGIKGKRHRVVARYRYYAGDGRRLMVRIRHEENDRLDPGVSPTRTGLSADYRYLPDRGWGFEAGASYRRSRFSDAATPRTENLVSARSALTRFLGRDWILMLEYRYSDNDSSDPVFSYDRNVLTIGAMRTF
jgi:tetratricopeptide (TPR) repeat protein